MATIAFTVDNEAVANGRIFKWASMGPADDGAILALKGQVELSVQMLGTFGAATVAVEGSLDGGVTWSTLDDPFGVALSFTSAGLKPIGPITPLIRPNVTGGTGTSVSVYLFVRAK